MRKLIVLAAACALLTGCVAAAAVGAVGKVAGATIGATGKVVAAGVDGVTPGDAEDER